jgi:GntR family transcriptional regulator/MocR family aminotransferase
VVLTPAHQYPRGVVLGARHRAAFVDWARREDGFIVEDDYDGEFRYDQQPVGAMQALAPDRVVFAGSTSKTLAPGMRLGWLVVPAALRRPLLEAMAEVGAAVPAVQQLAMADLIGRGGYDRHIRRMRLVYRRRRAELAGRLAMPLEGVAAGLHALLPVDSAERERALIARGAAGRGRLARAARPRLLAGARRGSTRRADPRVRHSPAARVVPGAGSAGGSGTGNLNLSGLRCWTSRCLVWHT